MIGTQKLLYITAKKIINQVFFETIIKAEDRKKIPSEKKLCFSYTGVKYRATEYWSKLTCRKCNG